MCYNKFKNTQLPDWLSFFSGKRCVAIVSGVVSIIASVVLLFVWPVIFGALVALGEAIVSLDAVGAGIYAFFNRLLIPFGLHHALNNVFWFDTIGLGDLTHFWAGETSADVTWSLGMYMSGFFPCMMFGIPGAALAMVHTAKPAKKKVAIGLVASAAIAAFVCGVTEPFEFGFMFLAPVLYVIYALLYGIFVTITTLVGFRAGFSFSAGATDLLFSASLPAAQKTWMIIPLGIAAFIVFYVVFRFAIVKLGSRDMKWTDPEVVETLQFVKDLIDAGAFDKNAAGMTDNIAMTQFQQGEAAMVITGPWNIGTFEDPAETPVCDSIEVAKFPYFEEKPEFKNEDMQTLSPYMISGKLEGKELELTLELVKMLTDKDAAKRFAEEAAFLIPRTDIDLDESAISPLFAKNVELGGTSEGIGVDVFDFDPLASMQDRTRNSISSMFTGEKPDSVAKEIQSEIDK